MNWSDCTDCRTVRIIRIVGLVGLVGLFGLVVPNPASRRGAPSLRAAESSRYVGLKPAKQSSAGSVTYVSLAVTTGLLRT
ncbi:MAG: hypothetical protein LBM98_10500 [Oscillospiraceae bacterium]|nr:hypothetical protein [Oscillospiraceae bacterium]